MARHSCSCDAYQGKKLGLRWLSDTLLGVVYRHGHIYDFDNQWWTYRLSPNNDEVHFVELRLFTGA